MTENGLKIVLEAIPDYAMLLDDEKRIVMANRRMTRTFAVAGPESLVGAKPGDAIGCIYRQAGTDGCGTGINCKVCSLSNSVTESRHAGVPTDNKGGVSLSSRQGVHMDVEILATPLEIRGVPFTICVIKDISGEQRRKMLERVFIHDMNNILTSIHGLAQILAMGEGQPRVNAKKSNEMYLQQQIERLMEEIQGQQRMSAAENGNFEPHLGLVSASEMIREVHALMTVHAVSLGCHLEILSIPECTIISDELALRRVLVNLTKNALEATDRGDTVTIRLLDSADELCFIVHNPGVMSKEVQEKLFRHSFSTRSSAGRGLGAYSIKLFGEGILGGKVTFSSNEPSGTTFRFFVPKRGGVCATAPRREMPLNAAAA